MDTYFEFRDKTTKFGTSQNVEALLFEFKTRACIVVVRDCYYIYLVFFQNLNKFLCAQSCLRYIQDATD